MKLKGKPPKNIKPESRGPYKIGDWVMVHAGKDQKVGQVIGTSSMLLCNVRFYRNEVWTEIDGGNAQIEVTSVEHPVPVTSIAFALPEEVAKNLLLLQGVEL